MSNAVYNGFIEVWIAFGNWCCGKRSTGGKRYHMNGTKRLLKNPFAGMGKLDVNQDRRREARALTEDELSRLLQAARLRPIADAEIVRNGPNKGKRLIKLSAERRSKLERLGHERSLIYKTAILTGLRKGELRTLTVSDLSFGDVPFLKLKEKHEKNRKGSTVPLRSDLAQDLKSWVTGRGHSKRSSLSRWGCSISWTKTSLPLGYRRSMYLDALCTSMHCDTRLERTCLRRASPRGLHRQRCVTATSR